VGNGISTAQAIDDVSTQSEASIFQQTGNEDPGSWGLSITQEGLAGGSNLFPEQIENPTPYFKMGYSALSVSGTYNTQGQHVLVPEITNCYGVGDCLMGSHFIYASGGFRDSADEGAHPFDLSTFEDSKVFVGTCASGCTTGSTTVTISPTAAAGTQGDGRFLIDTNPAKTITSAKTGGSIVSGTMGGPHATAQFSGTSFPVSVLLSTGQVIPTQSNNMAPGTVTFAIATTGMPAGYAANTAAIGSSSGLACLADQTVGYDPDNFEMAPYTVVDATHLQMTLGKPHQILATVAIGGLCGYGLEQTVDTTAGIRQLFPVIGAYSAINLYYAGGSTAVVGAMNLTSGFLNLNASIASVTRTANIVTVITTGSLSANVNGLSVSVAGVADSSYNGSYVATTIAPNSFTYSQTGANSSSTGGTVSVLTGGFALYPMAEVLSVFDQATSSVDGQMTLAPNNVPWAASDPVEEPHFYQEQVSADVQYVGQSVPRPTTVIRAGLQYEENNGPGLIGWSISNSSPAQNYLGYGGTHQVPDGAYESLGIWRRTMNLTAGEQAVFAVHCNLHGCGNWNSGYNLFELDSTVGDDLVTYSPTASSLTTIMRGTPYSFSPTAFTAGTIDVGTLNATTITGSLNGSNIASGTVGAAYLPLFGPSGSSHGPGVVPDPGTTAGDARYLREDGTWATPSGGGSGSGSVTITGGTIDDTVIGGATPAQVSATQLNGLPIGEYNNVPRKPLTTLLQALHNAGNQAVNIVVLSDSFGICDYTNCGVGPTASSNRYTEQLRINLQAQYGSHGTGMVPLVGVVGPTLNSEEWAVSGTWGTTNTLGPYQVASLAGSSLVHLSNGAVATFTSAIPYDTVNTYCMTNSASGSLSVAIDGVSVGTACSATTSSATAHAVTSASASLGTHVTTFTSTGDSYIYAAEGTAGTTGVSVHNLSVGSAAAEWFGLAPSAQLAFSDLIPTGTQGVLTMLQTNEPGVGYTVSSFTSAMNAIIAHEQALSSTAPPSVMMVVPPQDVITGLAPYTAAQVAISQSQNVAFLNIQDRWGTAYAPTSGLWDFSSLAPGIHPNDKGARDEYSMIYAQLVDPVPFGTSNGGCSTNCAISGTGSSPALTLSGAFRNIFAGASADAQGAYITLGGSGTGVDTWGIQSAGAGAGTNAAHAFLVGDFTSGIYSWASTTSGTGAGFNEFPSLNVHCWSSTQSVTANACDTGLSRLGAGSVALGNGSQGDVTGSLTLATIAGNSDALGITAAVTVNGGSAAAPLVTTTSNAAGNILELQGTGTGVHTWGFQSDAYGHWLAGDFTFGQYAFEMQRNGTANFLGVGNSTVYGWMTGNVTTNSATPDTGLSRTAADTVACGNGTQGDASCTFGAALYQGPATAPSGSCTTIGWAFSQDGHATFCNGSTWITKI
jgi:hypothetical protein